ncbi:hypothetical protein [Haliscomenobacter sp.]|uniref:hypothetical protein n=1 Tax=Haliscomenobacter sp. TaxID=2717303 RepID=UPI003BAD3141
MVDFTTTSTTITTFMRFALDNDALRRVVAVAIRRARRGRRGYIKSSEAAKKTLHYYSLLAADKDEPKASQSPFHSVQSVSSVFQSCRSTPKALKRKAHKKSSW